MRASHTGKFICYYRVSTQRQGRSGLGLEAQQKAVADYLNGGNWRIVGEFTEIESGKRSDRPKLAEALRACRVHDAKLVIAKLDRLARDAHFLLGLQKDGVDFVAADMPDANRLTVGILALVAEHEAKAISDRTKAALAAAKARGMKLGGNRGGCITAQARRLGWQANRARANSKAADLAPVIAELQAGSEQPLSLRTIAGELNRRSIPTPAGRGEWQATTVRRILARL
jgi:DNA invertase Pin-like site-specific DNA recombinase